MLQVNLLQIQASHKGVIFVLLFLKMKFKCVLDDGKGNLNVKIGEIIMNS